MAFIALCRLLPQFGRQVLHTPPTALAFSACLLLALCCLVARAGEPDPDRSPTYSQDVSKILDKNCLRCHRQGGAAAKIRLDTYEAVKVKAKEVREKVASGKMPPWPADSMHSLPFKNDPRMTAKDIATILAWIDSGALKGNDGDLPPHPIINGGWLHPEGRAPDAVVSLPKFTVRANGTVPYIQRLIKVPYQNDKWISALQVRAGNAVLLHHMGITEVALPDGMNPQSLDAVDALASQIGAPSGTLQFQRVVVADPANPGAYDMLGVYTPGTTFESYGPVNGKLLKGGKNLYIDFNIHYTTTGREETDLTQLALWFEPGPPDHILYRAPAAVDSIIANGRELLTDDPGTKAEGTDYALPPIPANGKHYELIGLSAYRSPITIFQLQPHAHVRAVDFRYIAVYPDGHEQAILTVPHYSYRFQLGYELAAPLVLPAGSKLIVVAHYDNSTNNEHLRNLGTNDAARRCGPENVAFFGQQNQSWDEMFTPLIQYSTGGPKADRLGLVTAVGCLVRETTGSWWLGHGSSPRPTDAQGTSSAELAASAALPLGKHQYELIGAEVFNPLQRVGHKVAVKGVLIPAPHGNRINVTSLQSMVSECPK
jgi:mono/diheme cytochrome c family protein